MPIIWIDDRTMSPSNETPSTAPPQPERFVYIVDDDEAVRDSLRWLLEGSGFNVRTFHSAESFLNAYTPGHFAVLILDVRMGGMSGIELHDELLRQRYDLPLIFMTGHGDVGMAVARMKLGAVDFLEKPFDDKAADQHGGERLQPGPREAERCAAARAAPGTAGPSDPARAAGAGADCSRPPEQADCR